ncbi:hypothetical protein [Bacteroides acidifaciens]|uniref:hypothetical protein n=1 Tax=Bacteroides acidifaciens TaxID=85831 RepID=UPI003F68FC49
MLQTCVLAGITFFNYFSRHLSALDESMCPLSSCWDFYVRFLLGLFLTLKWFAYMFLRWVFFA